MGIFIFHFLTVRKINIKGTFFNLSHQKNNLKAQIDFLMGTFQNLMGQKNNLTRTIYFWKATFENLTAQKNNVTRIIFFCKGTFQNYTDQKNNLTRIISFCKATFCQEKAVEGGIIPLQLDPELLPFTFVLISVLFLYQLTRAGGIVAENHIHYIASSSYFAKIYLKLS